MRIKNYLFGLVFFFGISLPVHASHLDIKIWTDQPEYLVREPIIVEYTVKNISDRTIRLTFLILPYQLKIKDQNGLTYRPRLSISLGFVGADSLRPGEAYNGSVNITGLYGVDSVGEYSCYLQKPRGFSEYVSPEGQSNLIKIIVKVPVGDEKDALDMLLEADKLKNSIDEQYGGSDLRKLRLGFIKYQELADRYPHSVYAPLALASATETYEYSINLEERKEIIPLCEKLIENYPNSIYFMSAFTSLIKVYEALKDKTGAKATMNSLIKKHPNTRISEEARKRLKQIKKWKF